MSATNPDTEFDPWTWHDSEIHGIHFVLGDTSNDDWTSELVLDIDVIVEWVQCGPALFRVAPAALTFHDVTDFKVNFSGASSGYQVALTRPSIIETKRERIKDQKICLDRPYYAWKFALSCMGQAGEMCFGASDFDQVFRAEPVLIDEQCLPSKSRPPIT